MLYFFENALNLYRLIETDTKVHENHWSRFRDSDIGIYIYKNCSFKLLRFGFIRDQMSCGNICLCINLKQQPEVVVTTD